jgi:transcription elongation factor GreA
MQATAMTRDGLNELAEALEFLTTRGRQEIAERIQAAISSEANLVENADYHQVREDQALLERRVAVLEEWIAAAQVVEPDLSNDVIEVGERVTPADLDNGEQLEYQLVGSPEADAFTGRISVASPLGRALLGRRLGEVALVAAPIGRRRFKVVAIDLPATGAPRTASEINGASSPWLRFA